MITRFNICHTQNCKILSIKYYRILFKFYQFFTKNYIFKPKSVLSVPVEKNLKSTQKLSVNSNYYYGFFKY